jgi:hypothetical protein
MKKFFLNHPIEILFSILFLTLAAILNLQFLDGANVNFTFSGHDEYQTVREVYSILKPLSFKHFIMAIISGDVLYYGRIIFYIDALFAYIPYKIWGIEGMVYAIRMTHVLELLLGVLFLSRFIKSNTGKVFFIFNVLILYYTAYFIMVPKPEPLQLLFLAIFIIKAHKVNWQFGWHFVWLGLAYGAKVDVLTMLPLFFLLPYILGYRKIGDGVKSIVAFFAGLIISIPCLLLAPVKPIFLKTYLGSTFGKNEQLYDTGVTFITWVKTGWLGAFSGGFWIGMILVAIVIWVLIDGTKNYLKHKQIEIYFIFTLIGLGFLLPVMLFTERLWPHYLWKGHVFILLGVAMFYKEEAKQSMIKMFLLIIVTIGGMQSIRLQGSHLFSLEIQSNQLVSNSKSAHVYLKNKKSDVVVLQDISVFYPFSEMLKINPYHPFATVLPIENNGNKIIWTDFINLQILENHQADYLIVNKYNFEEDSDNLVTEKDKMIAKDKQLIRKELGKTIFLDTTIGQLRIYKIIRE